MNKNIKNHRFGLKTGFYLLVILLVLVSIPLFAQASVKIINDVDVSANTGNKTVSEGTVETGDAKAKAEVKTIINDKVIEPIDIEVESKDGRERTIKVKNEIIVKDDKAYVESDIEADSQSQTKGYEFALNDEEGTIIAKLFAWLLNFIESLMAKIKNVFNFF